MNRNTRRGVVALAAWLAAIVMAPAWVTAQTVMSPGDIAMTGYGSSGTDAFSFVALRPLASGTSLSFTDRGWQASGGLRPGESSFELTLTTDLPCGAHLVATMAPLEVRDETGTLVGTTTGAPLLLSTSGDQILAFQGPEPTAEDPSPLVAALQMNGDWDGDATSTNTSAPPPGLVDGVEAMTIAPEVNNARHDCTAVAGMPIALRSSAHDASNWLRDDANPFDLAAGCSWSCESACLDPSVPTPGPDRAITAGDSTMLTIEEGSLGDALEWRWYEGSCGGAPVGTGIEVTVAPSTTTDYFVRGEGGCPTPEACAMVRVTVAPTPGPASRDQQRCSNLLTQGGIQTVIARAADSTRCIKAYTRGRIPSAGSCADGDERGKVAKALAKLIRDEEKKCGETPDFGAASGGAVGTAGVSFADGLRADLFGPDLDGSLVAESVDRATAACQRSLWIAASRCATVRAREFARCKKIGMKDGSRIDGDALAACLTEDPRGKIARACDLDGPAPDKIRKALGTCVAKGADLAAALAGCESGSVEAAALCVAGRTACRHCDFVGASEGVETTCGCA